jgi:hypothetical protein
MEYLRIYTYPLPIKIATTNKKISWLANDDFLRLACITFRELCFLLSALVFLFVGFFRFGLLSIADFTTFFIRCSSVILLIAGDTKLFNPKEFEL